MYLINKNSLGITLDNFYDYYYSGKSVPAGERKKLARWIAVRQGIKGSYAGLPAPAEYDYINGIKLFTGELIDMKASIGHIIGEEALRALYLLNVNDRMVEKSINNSKKGINRAVKEYYRNGFGTMGWFCCGKCTAAYWRNLSAEGVQKNRRILNAGLAILKKHRDGKGKWHRFPFYYTVLSLTGIDLPSAKDELLYARLPLERLASRKVTGKYEKRRKIVAERALEMMD